MTKQEIKNKMQVGDYNTLAKMLGCQPDAARKRFKRDKPEALAAMEKIVTSRDQIIEDQQN